MPKGIILNFKRIKLLDYVKLNKIFILLCLLFIFGIIVGCITLSETSWLADFIENHLSNTIKLHSDNSFVTKFYNCFIKYFIILIIYFLSGSSMFGVIIIPFITVWQGITNGYLISYLYSTQGIYGIAFNAIILIPPATLFIVCCFFAAKYSIDFSLTLAKQTLPQSRPIGFFSLFKEYCIHYIIIISITLICTFIEIILHILFLKFFSF